MKDLRIVSLIASSTEILCALGLEKNLVGRSHECDYPESILHLPICTSPKFQTDGSSYEIDKRVRAIVQEGLSVYKVDSQILTDLQPTHIVTQSQCEVCAVSQKDVEEAVCEIISSKPQIISLEPNSLEDIFADIARIGQLIGVENDAANLIKTIQTSMNELTNLIQKSKCSGDLKPKPRVALIEWIEPLMACGNWMPELLEKVCAINLFGESGKHSPFMSFEDLKNKDPDLIIIAPCGFNIERTKEEICLLENLSGWENLSAFKSKKIFIADGNQYFNRPGPRVLDSLQIMAEIIYPELFGTSFKNKAWQAIY